MGKTIKDPKKTCQGYRANLIIKKTINQYDKMIRIHQKQQQQQQEVQRKLDIDSKEKISRSICLFNRQ